MAGSVKWLGRNRRLWSKGSTSKKEIFQGPEEFQTGLGMSMLGALLCSGGVFSLHFLQRLASFSCAPRLHFWLSDHQKINKSNCGSRGGFPELAGPSPRGAGRAGGETWTGPQLRFCPAQAGGASGAPKQQSSPTWTLSAG